MKVHLLLFFIFIIYFSICVSNNYNILNDKKVTQIPFEFHNNIIVVHPIINNQTYNFIFDSGSKNTIFVKPILLDSVDIIFKSNLFISGLGAYDSVQMVKIHNCKFKLENLSNDSLTVFSLTEDVLQLDDFIGVDIDGVFGAELFANYYIHINYKKSIIELREKPFIPNNTYYKLHVDIKNDKAYFETVLFINNTSFIVSLLLDTGANIPILLKNTSPKQLGIANSINAEIGEGLSGDIYAEIARLPFFQMGNIQFHNAIIGFYNSNQTNTSNIIQGNIGNDILSRLDVYYAYPDNCIYYKTTRNTFKPFDFYINSIFIYEKKNKFYIKSIAENSAPFLAGLQQNDEIIKINNIKVENIKNTDVSSLLNRTIGKKVKVKYQRSGTIKQCKYIIKPII